MEQPTAVIADAIAGFMPEGDGGQDGLANLGNAQAITDALRAAGYSVARNPQRHAMTVEQQQELAQFVNRHSLENGCDMPDFAIAAYFAQCYQALCIAAESHVNWTKEPIMPCLCHTGVECSIEHRQSFAEDGNRPT